MKFKVSTKDVFGKTAIIAEISSSGKFNSEKGLPPDYWDFVPNDPQLEEACPTFNRRILTHAQVAFCRNLYVFGSLLRGCLF